MDETTTYTGVDYMIELRKQQARAMRQDPLQVLAEMQQHAMRQMMDNAAIPAYAQAPRIVIDRDAALAAALAAKPADPYAPFKEAIKAGKVVEYRSFSGTWYAGHDLRFMFPPDSYRIRPEPAKAPEPAMQFTTLTIKGDPAEAQWLESQSLRRPSDGPEMAIPEPQFPYNIEPSTALPACAGLMRVWADPCWARR